MQLYRKGGSKAIFLKLIVVLKVSNDETVLRYWEEQPLAVYRHRLISRTSILRLRYHTIVLLCTKNMRTL